MELKATLAALTQIQAGRVRPLAVLAPQRSAQLPNVPTSKESGYENFEISVWYGILAPAGVPRDIINRLNAELNKAIATPDLKRNSRRTAWIRWGARRSSSGATSAANPFASAE